MDKNNNENKNEGFIKLYRSFKKWEWYNNTNVVHIFLHCLLSVNHVAKKWQGMTIGAGSFVTSLKNISDSTGLTIQQVRTSLNKLKSTHELTCKTTNRNTVITVNNWNSYQEINTHFNKQITNKQQTNNKQITTNKNEKNVKNEKKINTLIGGNFSKIEKIENDPWVNNSIVELFKSEYERIYGIRKCYLNNFQVNRLLEISAENPEFKDKIGEIIGKFKQIKFSNGIAAPSLKWLIDEGNWARILNGECDQFIADTEEEKEEISWKL